MFRLTENCQATSMPFNLLAFCPCLIILNKCSTKQTIVDNDFVSYQQIQWNNHESRCLVFFSPDFFSRGWPAIQCSSIRTDNSTRQSRLGRSILVNLSRLTLPSLTTHPNSTFLTFPEKLLRYVLRLLLWPATYYI